MSLSIRLSRSQEELSATLSSGRYGFPTEGRVL